MKNNYGPFYAHYVLEIQAYYMNNVLYLIYSKSFNILIIKPNLISLDFNNLIYIKQIIDNFISEYNPKIKLSFLFTKEEINKLPNFIKDIIIL